MATAPWPGFAAAAPRLIKMTLLAVSALLSRSSVPTAASELVELTLLANAREKGAGIRLTLLAFVCTSVCPGAASWLRMLAPFCSLQSAWMAARRPTNSGEASALDHEAGSSILRWSIHLFSVYTCRMQSNFVNCNEHLSCLHEGGVYIHSLELCHWFSMNKFREEHGATPQKIAPAADWLTLVLLSSWNQ
jgi:hypothetical protein